VTSIADRIKAVRSALKLSQREFSRRINISQSLYCDIENGAFECKERYLKLISSEFGVNQDWIRVGNGDMFSIPPPDARLDYVVEIFKQFDTETQDEVLGILKSLLKIHGRK